MEDLTFSSALRRVLAPAGRTSKLDLIDPETEQIETISGFPSSPLSGKGHSGSGHGEGAVSADEGRGTIFALDRLARQLVVIDPKGRSVISTVPVSNEPRIVRYVASTRELWITEPAKSKLEILSVPATGAPIPSHKAFITTQGWTDMVVIDEARGRAYTSGWGGKTFVFDLKSRSPAGSYDNGCNGGPLALDGKRGLLFVGCRGKLNVLDLRHGGAILESQDVVFPDRSPWVIDVIAYDPVLAHLYVATDIGVVGIFYMSAEGKLREILGTSVYPGSHMSVDDRHQLWVSCPRDGQLYVFKDDLRPAG
ncbi:MAG TPA: hypothetical protein VGS07_00660 [Thermoanaerobaculia bacterium]|nr:hypothetical protein [Thermoanaerobaculia bacterium]